ncbi:hypothetical protein [Embleya hyalina]|uniref:Uncharacterized protein n=1 Tax=Embleya hyalina TaxID=516124 RepID=A0A401YG23_9ACTN|nr:hypothetical protein [Embleya hyalina]GCD93527.1 hypothetical protein EHYA_01171 [Embleya hyalina]
MTIRKWVLGNTQEDIAKGREFFERYRHAWCRDSYSGREGALMDVQGRQVHLRLRTGTEFTSNVRDLVILRLAPPALGSEVRYVGGGDASLRPEGMLVELCAVDDGVLATVQPADGEAWFALLADLERAGCPVGAVAEWGEPPFLVGVEPEDAFGEIWERIKAAQDAWWVRGR